MVNKAEGKVPSCKVDAFTPFLYYAGMTEVDHARLKNKLNPTTIGFKKMFSLTEVKLNLLIKV